MVFNYPRKHTESAKCFTYRDLECQVGYCRLRSFRRSELTPAWQNTAAGAVVLDEANASQARIELWPCEYEPADLNARHYSRRNDAGSTQQHA
jgi:hypothetical protein